MLMLGVLCAIVPDATAQKQPDVVKRESSLGVSFVSVPGTTVLFSVWETRLSDYEAFVRDSSYAWTYKPHFAQKPDEPVVGVNLQDAIAFCNWLTNNERTAGLINSSQSYRLPTNEEWDAAVNLFRGRKSQAAMEEKVQDERTFPWGLQWPPPPKVANYAEHEIPGYQDGFQFTAPVGNFVPTQEGLFDLAGNVWEWVWDREVRALPVGSLRGGSWAYFRPECLASAYRYEVPAELRAPTIGFRCVFDDRQRTATILADAETLRQEASQKRQQEMKPGVDPKEVAAMQKRLLETSSKTPTPDATLLKPAVKGSPFVNTLGQEFVPVEGVGVLVGKFEVRVSDYEKFVSAEGRAWGRKPPFLIGDVQDHPAVGLTWDDATAFCAWMTKKDRDAGLLPQGASYRLPMDAEWSILTGMPPETGADPAARNGGNKLHFPWGNDLWTPPASSVNIDSEKTPPYRDSFSYTSPVGSFSANALGIHDLGGNAAEWCQDEWPGSPVERVFRGGSWLSSTKESLLSSARGHLQAGGARPDLGFRCVIAF